MGNGNSKENKDNNNSKHTKIDNYTVCNKNNSKKSDRDSPGNNKKNILIMGIIIIIRLIATIFMIMKF